MRRRYESLGSLIGTCVACFESGLLWKIWTEAEIGSKLLVSRAW